MCDDYAISEDSCPKCNHPHTHSRPCYSCEDGYVDRHEDDPLYYDEGDLWPCNDCRGDGYFHWCPNCGFDLVEYYKKVMR